MRCGACGRWVGWGGWGEGNGLLLWHATYALSQRAEEESVGGVRYLGRLCHQA